MTRYLSAALLATSLCLWLVGCGSSSNDALPSTTSRALPAADVTIANIGDLQAAIDAAPGTPYVIELEANTYTVTTRIELRVANVTLRGPQAGVDPRPSAGSTRTAGVGEAVLAGSGIATVLNITADNVTIDGLEIRSGSGDMIAAPEGSPQANPVIRNCIIHDATGDEGVQLKNVSDALYEQNHVYDTRGDGLNIAVSTGGTIRNNEVHDIHSSDGAIYSYGSAGLTIEGNLVYNTTSNDGIKLGSKSGSDSGRTGGTITSNVIHDTVQDGISVYMSGVLVDGNEVYNSSSWNGAIYVSWYVADITITNNRIHDNTTTGILLGKVNYPVTSIHVHNNCIVGNDRGLVNNNTAEVVDAENNWWGAVDGPSGSGPGSGDSVSDYVDFDPWLGACPSQTLTVTIDIKPGSDPNSINLKSKGNVPVAILGSADFDVQDIDPTTIVFAGAPATKCNVCDVNGDGYLDLLCHFQTQELDLTGDSTEATLTGKTTGGDDFEGSDSVRIVPKR